MREDRVPPESQPFSKAESTMTTEYPSTYPPVEFLWVPDTNKNHVPGIWYLEFAKSGARFAEIVPIERGWPFGKKTITYRAVFAVKNRSGQLVGRECATLEEAKQYLDETSGIILRGWPDKEKANGIHYSSKQRSRQA